MQQFLQASQSHLVLIIASGIMLGLFVVGVFQAGIALTHREGVTIRVTGTAIMILSFLFGAWITITTMMGY